MALLELEHISKSFGTNQVLKNVNFQLEAGEVHALLGENGAGKSTMLNIIGGLLEPNGGTIRINGEEKKIHSILEAKELGIGFVHQEIELCQDVTVAENIMMSSISDSNALRVNFKKIAKEAGEILKPIVGDAIDPMALVSSLPISQQQVVEIAKALAYKCRILLLDEPTAALSESEAEALFKIMGQLKAEGMGIIFISHRMEEVFEQSDRVTVLRDGEIISTRSALDAQLNDLIRDMAGREITDIYPPKAEHIDYTPENVLLKVEDLTDAKNRFKDINFSLYKGEVLGLAGLVGSGRTEILQTIVNLRKRSAGHVTLLGENIDKLSTSAIYNKGLVLLSEDRKKSGLFLNGRKENELAGKWIGELGIRAEGPRQVVGRLSGGNQQKALLAKLLAKIPKVILLDEPTRGVDVGAKSDIGKYIRNLANEGIGVIIISSEMNELLGLCDRLIMIDIDGDQVPEVTGDPFNSDTVVYYISGAYKYEYDKEAT